MALEAAVTEVIIKALTDIGIKVYEEIPKFKFNEPFKQLLFNATKKYFQTYNDRHGQVQVLGMSRPVPLDAIYFDARMLDSHAMKSYDSGDPLEKTYLKRGIRRFRHQYYPKRNGIDIANKYKRLIVLGEPGIGMSTFLRKVGLEALKGAQGSYRHEQIPVFLELKRWTSAKLDLEACIVAEFESCGFPSSERFSKEALNKGQLLILFDGLDEVPADNLNIVIEKIQDFVDRYSDNRFIASCRIATYHTYFNRVDAVAISEFDNAQIEKFITDWFSSELEQQSKTAQKCWELLQKPENKEAKGLAQSPLLLTFLCIVYNKSLSVPGSRTTLYEDALNILLKEWASEARVGRGQIYEGFHTELEKQLLAKIAYQGLEENRLFFSKEQLMKSIADFLGNSLGTPDNLDALAVLEAIEVQQGIFVERANDVYSFSHLTLQEFLTAKYIVNWNLLDPLVELHRSNERWREIFLLVTELMGEAAIGLLEKLEAQTQELSKYPKLMGLLSWVDSKTTPSICEYSRELRQVFTLILILDSNLALDLALDLARSRSRSSNLADASNLALAKALDLVRSQTCTSISKVRVGASARFILDKQLITDVDLQTLISYLDIASDPSKVLTKEVISTISASLNISSELLDLSRDDMQVITNYLSTYQLMIDCSKQASGLSAQQWKTIKQRMFLPKSAV